MREDKLSNMNDIKMSELFDRKFIRELQDVFMEAFGIACISVTNEGPYTQASHYCEYCKYIQSVPEGKMRCINCALEDNYLLQNTPEMEMHSGKCFAGLTLIGIPLKCNKKHLGAFYCGQVLTEGLTVEDYRRIENIADELGLDRNSLIKAAEKIKILPMQKLDNIAKAFMVYTSNISAFAYKNVELKKSQIASKLFREILQEINKTNESEKILLLIAKNIATLLDVQKVSFIRYTKDNVEVLLDYRTKPTIKSLFDGFEFSTPESKVEFMNIWRKLLVTGPGEVNVFTNIDALNVNDKIKEGLRKCGAKSGVSAVISKDEYSKVVALIQEFEKERVWSDAELNLLRIVTAMADNSLSKALMYKTLKQKEKQELTIINNLPMSTWLKSVDGKYLYVNDAYCNLNGMDINDIVGKRDEDIFLPETVKIIKKEDNQVIKTQTTYSALKQMNLNGQSRWVEVFKAPVFDENGNIVEISASLKDVTAQREIENIKNEFISMVSHELRTPLTSIIGALGIIQNGMVGEVPNKIAEMLDITQKNSTRLLKLINDILDIEKIEAGKMVFDKVNSKISQLIEKAVLENETYALPYEVEFKYEDETGDKKAFVDELRFVQVISNLLSNAAKFADKNTVVYIKSYVKDNNIEISVEDRGVEIPKEKTDMLFEKFSQIDSTDRRKRGGTGLGLSISKKIIDEFNGNIWYESKDNLTVFYISLPIAE